MIDHLSSHDIEEAKSRVRSFGFTLLPGRIEASVLQGLKNEAEERRASAAAAEQSELWRIVPASHRSGRERRSSCKAGRCATFCPRSSTARSP